MLKYRDFMFKLLGLLFLVISFSLTCHAQLEKKKSDFWGEEQKDFPDFTNYVLNTKPKVEADSVKFRPHKLYYAAFPGIGYTLQAGLSAVFSNNFSFYLGEIKHTNISVIASDLEYSPSHKQLLIPVMFNIWRENNTLNVVGDVRYYKYPTYTYGTGDNSLLEIRDLIDYNYLKIHTIVLKPIRKNLYTGFGIASDIHWKIIAEDSATNYHSYNDGIKESFSNGLQYNIKFDSRKNTNNSQDGFYASLVLRQNFKFLGSTSKWNSAIIDVRKYVKLSKSPYFLLGFWNYLWLTGGKKIPYLDLPSTGWDPHANMARGYIQGRLRGRNLLYSEVELRFNFTKNGLLGGVVFANTHTVSNNLLKNNLKFHPSYGGGLRFKVNKYSNVNFCIDYGIGTNGSRGFFFDVAEIF